MSLSTLVMEKDRCMLEPHCAYFPFGTTCGIIASLGRLLFAPILSTVHSILHELLQLIDSTCEKAPASSSWYPVSKISCDIEQANHGLLGQPRLKLSRHPMLPHVFSTAVAAADISVCRESKMVARCHNQCWSTVCASRSVSVAQLMG